LEAERAWAYAQELNLQATKDDDSALRHRSTGRFRRALNYTLELKSQASSLFPSRISATSLLEITVYTFIMHGRFLLRRDDFKSALDQLAVARNILDELASAATTSRDQALYVLFADEIAPEIRYCGHSLGRAKSYDIDAVVADVGPKSRKTLFHEFEALIEALKKEKFGEGKGEQRKKLKELVWEGQPVPIRNPELVDVFLRVQEAEAQLQNDTRSTTARTESTAGGSTKKGSRHKGERGRIASYDGILLTLSDAEEVARKLAESQQV
jgi:signal recognition particle subunit SRP68